MELFYKRYIPIEEAFEYLEDSQAVYELKKLYLYYKGFALEDEREALWLAREPKSVYLEALSILNGAELDAFWSCHHNGINSLETKKFKFCFGNINGKWASPSTETEDDIVDYVFSKFYEINFSNVFVRRLDLDQISEEYGIPKTHFRGNSLNTPLVENKSSLETGDAVNLLSNSPHDFIIDFTKSVLIQHPNLKTADIRRNCFEDMEDLNSRDGKIINDLLIKAGAIKSSRGEHAIQLEWESKCPKVQWERVFNKKK
jgi:hypothetical protein